MAQSTSSRLLDSSYIESFIAILRKLAIKEFASEKIPRHSVIRKQIESLVTSRSDIETLCSALHKDLMVLVSQLPLRKIGRHSLQVELWPQFHLFRIEELPQIWKKSQKVVEDIDIILAQKATMEYVLLLLQEKYSQNKEESSPMQGKKRDTP